MSDTIDCIRFTYNQNGLNFHLMQFQVYGQAPIQINIMVQLPNNFQAIGENQVPIEVFFHYLEQSFNVFPFSNGSNSVNHEKLVVMHIDDASKLNGNLLTMANEFNQRGIYLVVIANAIPTYEIWDYYKTLTYNIGGHFTLLKNAPVVFNNVISSVLTGENTLHQAFLHVNTNEIGENSLMTNHINDMNENNQKTDGIGDLPFDHGLS